jgi:UDP-glucose 4-epimerase
MKILVTGGAGFIGSQVTRAYLEAGHQVVVVDDLSRGKRERVPTDIPLYTVDICDQEAVQEILACERPDVVNHHAALVSVRESHQVPERYHRVNWQGTQCMVDALPASVWKFVFASSGGAIYGEAPHLPVTEETPTKPISPYGESKLLAENLLMQRDHLETVILRYGNVYGPDQDLLNNNGVITIFTRALLDGAQPAIFGDGTQMRDYVFIDDAAQANLCALKPGLRGIFNIATGTGHTLLEVYQKIAAQLQVDRPLLFRSRNSYEVLQNILDIQRAQNGLGWQPQVPFDDGLRLTVHSIAARVADTATLK